MTSTKGRNFQHNGLGLPHLSNIHLISRLLKEVIKYEPAEFMSTLEVNLTCNTITFGYIQIVNEEKVPLKFALDLGPLCQKVVGVGLDVGQSVGQLVLQMLCGQAWRHDDLGVWVFCNHHVLEKKKEFENITEYVHLLSIVTVCGQFWGYNDLTLISCKQNWI